MKIRQAVKNETKNIALGTALLCVIMLLVCVMTEQFEWEALYGAILGGCFAVLNFFLMGLTVQRSLEQGNEFRAKRLMQISFTVRLLLALAVAAAGILLLQFNPVTVILPLFFPRVTVAVLSLPFLQRKKPK